MKITLIDTHCHLDAEAFHQDLDDVITRAAADGVRHLLTIGVTLHTSQAAVILANRYPNVSAVVGIQPNYAQEAAAGDWDAIVELASHPQVAGIGETGLDQYWDHTNPEIQRDYFRRHIALSQQCGKPFVVHCRDAEENVIAILREAAQQGPLHGVMHSFCGTAADAAACLELGLYISFAGMLTFRKNDSLREIAATVPLNRLLVETDSPYLAPHPNRGKRNEPAWIRHTAQCLADVHDISLEEISAITTKNASELFGLQSVISG